VLSDALLGRGSKELYTSLSYNHKPTLSSGSSLSPHELKPSSGQDSAVYDLSFSDGSDQYAYQGVRSSGDGQYILIFDPDKKHFVLHQIDSTLDMNLTSAPWDQDPTSLRDSYPQLEPPTKPRRKSSSQPKAQSAKDGGSAGAAGSSDGKRRKNEKTKKTKAPAREPTPEAEDEDSDDGLTIEYPGGAPPPRFQSRAPPFTQNTGKDVPSEQSDMDAEYEEDEEEHNQDVEDLKLPSPVGNAGLDVEDELELDLEAELEQALASETGNKGDESSESEEE